MKMRKIYVLLFMLLCLTGLLLFLAWEKNQTNNTASSKTEIETIVDTMIHVCGKRQRSTQSCYDKQFFNLTKSHSSPFALEVLSVLEKRDGRINHCHSIAHMIADAEIAKDYTKWRDFVTSLKNPTQCTRGLIHGAIEGLTQYDDSFKMEPAYLSQFCYGLRGAIKGSQGEQDCSHALGHIFLVMFENDITQAVASCNQLDEDLVFLCHDGLFMESILRDMLIAHGVAEPLPFTMPSVTAQEDICRQQVGVAAKACWRELTLLYISLAKYTPDRLWKLCQRANTKENRQECYLHSAFLAFNANFIQKDHYYNLCSPFFTDEGLYSACLFRVVYSADLQSKVVVNNFINLCSVQPKEKKETCCTILKNRAEESISAETAYDIGKQCENYIKPM